jgi:hypothetical protein
VNTVTKTKTLIFLVAEKILNSQDGFSVVAAIPVQTWRQAQVSEVLGFHQISG